MNIKKALKFSENIFISNNIPSASLDAEILLLEALNKNSDTRHGIATPREFMLNLVQ